MRKRGARAFAGARPDDKHACFNNVLAGTENNAFGLAVNWIGDGDGREKKTPYCTPCKEFDSGYAFEGANTQEIEGSDIECMHKFRHACE